MMGMMGDKDKATDEKENECWKWEGSVRTNQRDWNRRGEGKGKYKEKSVWQDGRRREGER